MNYEKVWLEKAPCVLSQAGAEPEQSSGEEEKQRKGASEMESIMGKFWKRRRNLMKELRSTSRKREEKERLVANSEERKTKNADCNRLAAEANHVWSLLRELKSVQMQNLRC